MKMHHSRAHVPFVPWYEPVSSNSSPVGCRGRVVHVGPGEGLEGGEGGPIGVESVDADRIVVGGPESEAGGRVGWAL